MQTYVDGLNDEIITKANKLQMANLQIKQLKHECANKLREKDYEIQRLHDKIKKSKSKLMKLRNSILPDK